MKIVKILGGLGNQMFLYALYLALRETFPQEEVRVDLSCFRGYPLHNGFEVDAIFGLQSDAASWRDLARVAYPYPNYRCWQIGKYILPKRKTMCIEQVGFVFDDTVLAQAGDRYFDGYWQHEEYFLGAESTVRKAFTFPPFDDDKNQKALSRIQEANSISIHIRRGDYVDHPLFKGICDMDYYQKAIAYAKEKLHPTLFCIFSNDAEWCKEHLGHLLPAEQTVYVDWNKGKDSYRDMQLMSLCHHHIIANSSFSWWGAWLGNHPGTVVIAPHKWANEEMEKDPIPERWIRI